MSNYNKKKSHKPASNHIDREQQTLALQEAWQQKAEELAKEKAELGYADFPLDAFLEISVDSSIHDTVTLSRIVDLQERCKELLAERERLWAEDNVVKQFNQRHAVIRIDQTYILTEKVDPLGRYDFSLESRQSFKTYYEDERVVCADGKERSKADIWLRSPKRRKYSNIIFDPRSINSNDSFYNMWKGFTKIPAQGSCQKYWDHVRDNICNSDDEAYLYLRKWLAFIFQKPHIVHTAVVLCGLQGVGKNQFVNPLGELLGSHYAPLSSISELISNFNYHLKNAVLIHANEALWGGNKKDIGTVKAMITEEWCLIEGKGKDRITVRNFKHVILSSNEDWPVHLDADDRRFLILNVSDKRKEDKAYFRALQDELNNGGYEALLYDLLNENISNFDPRTLPTNSNSFSIKMRSASSTHRYLYDVLNEGGFAVGKDESKVGPVWQSTISKQAAYKDYSDWCEINGEKSESKELLGKAIKRLIVSVKDVRPGGSSRVRSYEFATLRRSQEDFAKAFKEKPERIFDTYKEEDCE